MGLIRITFETITEESAQDGDAAERGWLDEEGKEYTRDEAIQLLRDCGPMEASSSEFHQGVWYTCYGEMDAVTGETENVSYHLKGFTEEEERAIYARVSR